MCAVTCTHNVLLTCHQRLESENALLKADNLHDSWICESPAMRDVMTLVDRVAKTDINVLLTGENGTGKSQLAEIIHRQSSRHHASLVTVNMGGINESVFESELFGHVKGAFTDARENRMGRFELAESGSLFMDEVGNIPLAQQAKLLRVLESGQFERLGASRSLKADVRIISATNADLDALVANGAFRKDLLYRLNSIEIRLPSLRERQEDIQALSSTFIAKYAVKHLSPVRGLSDAGLKCLKAYAWPGNIRELEHLIERAVLMADGELLTEKDLALVPQQARLRSDDWAGLSLDDAEKRLIEMAMDANNGSAIAAAKALGVSRSAFYRRLEKYGL